MLRLRRYVLLGLLIAPEGSGIAARGGPDATVAPQSAPQPRGPSARFAPMDVFDLEWATDSQIAPDGRRTVYVRNFMDIKRDRRRSTLWMVSSDGSDHRALTSGNRNDASPRWSPDGRRLVFASRDEDGGVQLHLRWMDSGETARLTNLLHAPSGLAWSPDGRSIAFTMFVPEKPQPFAPMPDKPEGATWAEPPRVIRKLIYRADGQGYLRDGHTHVFVLSADGGTPRQLTTGAFDHVGPLAWTPDGRHVLVSANRRDDGEYEPLDSEIQALKLRRIDTALVRVPDAPHEIIVRPSQLIAKVTHILAWFEKYRKHPTAGPTG